MVPVLPKCEPAGFNFFLILYSGGFGRACFFCHLLFAGISWMHSLLLVFNGMLKADP